MNLRTANPIEQKILNILEKCTNQRVDLDESLSAISLNEDKLEDLKVVIKEEFILNNLNFDLTQEDDAVSIANKIIGQLMNRKSGSDVKKTKLHQSFHKAEEKEFYMASSPQKRLYAIQRTMPEDTSYNMPLCMRYRNLENEKILVEAFEKIIQRHESLRTNFVELDGEIYQKIRERVDFKVDVQYLDNEKIEEKLEEFVQPFNLTEDILFRVSLVKENQKDGYLFIDSHHIVFDGASYAVLFDELRDFYVGNPKTELAYQFKDYSEHLKTIDYEKQGSYWRKVHEEPVEVVDLPLDSPRSADNSNVSQSITSEFSVFETNKIKTYLQEAKLTPYVFFIASLMIIVSKYTRQEDIVIASSFSGRKNEETQKMIGMFVNTLILRGNADADKVVKSFLLEIREHALNAQSNSEYPYEDLLSDLKISNLDPNRNMLYDIMFTMQNNTLPDFHIGELLLESPEFGTIEAKCDLDIDAYENEEQESFVIHIAYNSSLFKKENIEYFAEHWRALILSLIDNPDKKISDLTCLSEEEKKKVIYEFNPDRQSGLEYSQ
ncbi:MAG TPA: hypothetical protein GXZ76_06835, partial [Clostridiaceae bacterium]|nr:hypothetical protein [Clostridiaceae bacterium]